MFQSGINELEGYNGRCRMVKEKISECIDMVRSIDGVAACALISRDGIVAGNYLNRDLNERRSGAFLATLPSSVLANGKTAGESV